MKSHGNYSFPVLRREITSLEQLGEMINRETTYCSLRICGRLPFTEKEKNRISKELGIDRKILFEEA